MGTVALHLAGAVASVLPAHPPSSPGGAGQDGGMARKKRSSLPSVTEMDLRLSPDQVRRTPHGGWAWKCAYCARYARDRSVAGKFLCRCRGGSTPRQRDPLLSYLHLQQTGQKLRTPGRPLVHGRYARAPSIFIAAFIAALLAEYHERRSKQVQQERRWIRKEIIGMQAQLRALRHAACQ
jgi:hypothetical protein